MHIRPQLLLCVALAAQPAVAQSPGIDVSSDKAQHFQEEQKTLFSGSVVVTVKENELQLFGDTLSVEKTGEEEYRFVMDAAPVRMECGNCMDKPLAGRLGERVDYFGNRVAATGGIEICAAGDCDSYRIVAASAEWAQDDGVLHLAGAPFVRGVWRAFEDGERIEIRARKIVARLASDIIELSGDAEVKRGDSKINSELIRINTVTGELSAKQRVQATY